MTDAKPLTDEELADYDDGWHPGQRMDDAMTSPRPHIERRLRATIDADRKRIAGLEAEAEADRAAAKRAETCGAVADEDEPPALAFDGVGPATQFNHVFTDKQLGDSDD